MPVIAALINARGWRTPLLWLAGLLALVVVPPYALVVRSRVRYASGVAWTLAVTFGLSSTGTMRLLDQRAPTSRHPRKERHHERPLIGA